MKITIAQLNPTIGDITGNLEKAFQTIDQAHVDKSDLVVFPELFITGYPPRDLLERPSFIERVQDALEQLQQYSKQKPETGILMGAPVPTGKPSGRGLYNAAVLIQAGAVLFTQHKTLLPTYDVFDEERYFDAATAVQTIPFRGETLGITVCEDAWNDPELWEKRLYDTDPVEDLVKQGVSLLINISASPYHVGKEVLRNRILSTYARKFGVPAVMVNQVGGNDELIFDGRSMFVDSAGDMVTALPAYEEQVQTVDSHAEAEPDSYAPLDDMASMHDALVLGLKDYIGKCGFTQVVLGLSGGIDSAVTCCLAVEAIGAENVLGVAMPSQYSSQGSIDDARSLADNLGMPLKLIPITDIFSSYMDVLQEHFEGREPDLTEENIQARIRGALLMSLSNKFGSLLLTTGNKSELAVGYCTLYGDMCGGLAVISDVPKTMVYSLAEYINRDREVIPRETITKPPSAELRPDQTDQDSLPEYDVLDRILYHYVDEMLSLKELLAMDFDPDVVRWVVRAVDLNEYKRKQAPPGLKVTTKAFGMGRRMVISAKYEK